MNERDPSLVRRERIWRVATTITGLLTAMIAKNVIRRVYRAIRKDDPTAAFDPAAARFTWPNAFGWAIAGGVGLVVAKMVGDRIAAVGWKVATGAPPPGASKASAG